MCIGLVGLFGHPCRTMRSASFCRSAFPSTFQSIGYTLDVYIRRIEAERNFIVYAQYVSFFPQLVAGSDRAGVAHAAAIPQAHRLKFENIPPGLWLIGYGLFKKMCVADSLAPIVNGVFAEPAELFRHLQFARGAGVYRAALLRLLGIFGHRARRCPDHGLRSDVQFPSALLFDQP